MSSVTRRIVRRPCIVPELVGKQVGLQIQITVKGHPVDSVAYALVAHGVAVGLSNHFISREVCAGKEVSDVPACALSVLDPMVTKNVKQVWVADDITVNISRRVAPALKVRDLKSGTESIDFVIGGRHADDSFNPSLCSRLATIPSAEGGIVHNGHIH
jgi:hypothetical protein